MLADEWRETARNAGWAKWEDYLDDLKEVDPDAEFKIVGGEPIIFFSDGSTHIMRAGSRH